MPAALRILLKQHDCFCVFFSAAEVGCLHRIMLLPEDLGFGTDGPLQLCGDSRPFLLHNKLTENPLSVILTMCTSFKLNPASTLIGSAMTMFLA